MKLLGSKEANKYGKRGAKKTADTSVYRIEGENVTITQIAERLGVDNRVARYRMTEARKMPGVTTWAMLQR